MPKIPNAFEATHHYTERTVNQRFVEWINRIIEEKNLSFGVALQEAGMSNRKSPDIIIQESPQSKRIICLIELKLPSFADPLSESELIGPASTKAWNLKSPYFATCNVNQLVLFSTQKSRQLVSLPEQIIHPYTLTDIADPDAVDQPRIRLEIQKNLEHFLTQLSEIAKGENPVSKMPIDEVLIFRLHSAIRVLQIHYEALLEKRIAGRDKKFIRCLKKWFKEQNWSYSGEADLEKVARQAAYLLINKIVFYTALQEKYKLDPISIPPDLTDSKILKGHLQTYFKRALDIDYETIFTTDFIDEISFPQAPEAIRTLREVLEDIKRYKMSQLGYDVIGRIFERLIPDEERHNFGQYFTRSDVVDLILGFCLRREEDKVFDPACGTGTFLIRAYKQKELCNPRLKHEAILKTLWGGDIAKFPVSLATINLAIRDLVTTESYPGIFQKDFFKLHPDLVEFTQPRKVVIRAMDGKKVEFELPRYFDCLVGNPPYTRQEEMEELIGEEGYKNEIIKAVTHYRNKKIAELGKRAGIYAHFFLHGWKFLKEEGYFGFIVSNSWLDVDYGKFLQEFFLKHYKIVTIIESKVERWFEDADINTCIVILEKCGHKKARDENLVRFVCLKKPLTHFVPPAGDRWEEEIKRRDEVDNLRKLVLAQNEFCENEEIRVYPKLQKELWDEGYDKKERKYVGAKWGKYIRAPQIFFKILEKSKDKLVPLKEIADVRFGIKTGANEFFYLTEDQIKRWKIEKEFWMHKDEKGKWVPNYVIKSPRECKSIVVKPEDLKYRVLMVHKDKEDLKGTKVLKYIKHGERQGYHKRPTCASRGPGRHWYDLGENINDIIAFPERVRLRHIAFYNNHRIFLNKNLYGIKPIKRNIAKTLSVVLNSTLTAMYLELFSRQPGGGGGPLDTDVYVAKDIFIPKETLLKKHKSELLKILIPQRKIESIFIELGASSPEEVSLDKVKPDRRELDRIIMGEILGLTNEEQLGIYRSVIDLVSFRIKKAESVKKKKKIKGGVDIDAFVETVMKNIGEQTLGKFYQEKILTRSLLMLKNLPKAAGKITISSDLEGFRLYYGKKYILCRTKEEARYLKVWIEAELENIKVPKDDDYLAKIIPQLEKLMEKIKKVVNSYIDSILQPKLRQKILHHLWQRLTDGVG